MWVKNLGFLQSLSFPNSFRILTWGSLLGPKKQFISEWQHFPTSKVSPSLLLLFCYLLIRHTPGHSPGQSLALGTTVAAHTGFCQVSKWFFRLLSNGCPSNVLVFFLEGSLALWEFWKAAATSFPNISEWSSIPNKKGEPPCCVLLSNSDGVNMFSFHCYTACTLGGQLDSLL